MAILSAMIPYRVVERDIIIDHLCRTENKKRISKMLNEMEQNGYVERLTIYRKAITDTWRVVKRDDVSRYQKAVGYDVERITPLGFVRLLTLYQGGVKCSVPFLPFVPSFVSASLPWGLFQARANGVNRCRKKQAILNALSAINIDVTDCYNDAIESMSAAAKLSEAKPSSISAAIVSAILSCRAAPSPAVEKQVRGHYYCKRTISKRKTFSLDNIWGVVQIGENAYPTYHTDSYYGTAWGLEYKKDTVNEIQSFFIRKEVGSVTIPAALMFTSSPKEIADILCTCHNEPTDAKKLFLGYAPKTPIEINSVSSPFAKTIVVPEQMETPEYLKLIFSGKMDTYEEQFFADALAKAYPDAIYNSTDVLKNDEADSGIAPAFTVPESAAKRALFLSSSFPFSAVLSNNPDSPVVPVLFGYEMELTRLSRAFYFYRKTAHIGTTLDNGVEKRAMVVACFPWQVRWYKKIFPDAIYLCEAK